MLTSFHTSKKNLLRRYDAAGRNARKKAKLFLRMTIPQKRKDNENWSLPLRGIYLLVLVDTDKLTYNDKDRIIAPFYDIELETGIVISTLIMPRKEWENRPFLTPFQYNVKKRRYRTMNTGLTDENYEALSKYRVEISTRTRT